MRALPYIVFLLMGISTAQAQNNSFYLGLSCYLSSKYPEASGHFAQSVKTAQPQHKTDIYYLDALCQYFQHNYPQSLKYLDSSAVYRKKYPQQALYFNYEDMLRYRAMNYEKMGNKKKEISVLQKMVAETKSKWAKERLKALVSANK